MQLTEVKLPSGRVVTIRRPSAQAFIRVHRVLPVLQSIADRKPAELEPLELEQATDAQNKIIALCSVDPRYWIDPRAPEEQEMDPRDPPEGWSSIHELDFDEAPLVAAACVRLLNAEREEEKTLPLVHRSA